MSGIIAHPFLKPFRWTVNPLASAAPELWRDADLYLFGEGLRPLSFAPRAGYGSVIDGTTLGVTPLGVGMNAEGGASAAVQGWSADRQAVPDVRDGYSVLSVFRLILDAGSVDYQGSYYVGQFGGNQANFGLYQAVDLRFFVHSQGGNRTLAIPVTPMAGDLVVSVTTYDGAQVGKSWTSINGQPSFRDSTSLTPPSGPGDSSLPWSVGGGWFGNTPRATHLVAGAWRRVLADEEAERLLVDPFLPFRPAERRIIVASVAPTPDAPATALADSGVDGSDTYIDVYPSDAYNDPDGHPYDFTRIQYSRDNGSTWTTLASPTTRPTSGSPYRIRHSDVSADPGDGIYVRMADADDTDGLGSYGTVLETFFPVEAPGTTGGGGGVDILYAKRDGQSISIKIAIN